MTKVDSALDGAVAGASMGSVRRGHGCPAPAKRRSSLHVWRAVGVGLVTAIIVGVPTDVIDTPYFIRMTPVRWWEVPVVVLTVVLAALWAGLQARPRARRHDAVGVTSVVVTALAVGCPVCNKIAVALLGVSGALTVWSPIQPVLALGSLAVLGAAVLARWRATARCATCERPATRPLGADHVGDRL